MRPRRVPVRPSYLVTAVAAAVVVLCGACSAEEAGTEAPVAAAIFGTEDTTCESVATRNEDGDEELLRTVADCLLDEVAAGRAVTVDVAILSAEGDPIYQRFAFDGDAVLIVEDNRADEFGTPVVSAQICTGLQPTRWLPEGTDCTEADHPGFPEAVR